MRLACMDRVRSLDYSQARKIIMHKIASIIGVLASSTLLPLCNSALAQSRQDVVATANCVLFEQLDIRDFRLEYSDIENALRSTNLSERATPQEIDEFRRFVTYPDGCVADEGKVKNRMSKYVVSEFIGVLSEVSGNPVAANDLNRSRAKKDCARLEEQMDGDDALVRFQEIFVARYNEHPFLSSPKISNASLQDIKWRAYHIGRKRFEMGGQTAVDRFAEAFSRMRNSMNNVPARHEDVPLFYLIDAKYFPDRNSSLFGTVSAGSDEPLDFVSYVAWRRTWRYIITGKFGSTGPAAVLEDAGLIDMSASPEIDLTPYLNGRSPDSEQCQSRTNAGIVGGADDGEIYLDIIKSTESALSYLLGLKVKKMIETQGGEKTSTGMQSFRSLVSPHLFEKADARKCVTYVVDAQLITDFFDENGALANTAVKTETVRDPDGEHYDDRWSGPAWSPSLSATLQAGDPLSEPQKQAILSEQVMTGSFKSYYDGVRLSLVDKCETERVEAGIGSMEVPKTVVLQSKVVAGKWRAE